MNYNVTRRTVIVPASGTVTVDVAGTYLLMYASTGTFDFSVNGNPFQNGFCVLGLNFAADLNNLAQPFTSVKFTDTSGAQNSISFVISMVPVTYTQAIATVYQKDAPTYSKMTAGTALAAGSWSTAFSGVDSGGQIRKHFILSNFDTTQELVIGDGTIGAVICPAKQSRIVAVGGPLKVGNLTGSGLSNPYAVEEVFYV